MRKYLTPLYTLPVTALVLLSVIFASVVSHMGALSSGREIVVSAQGYDPRAILLGHYVRLIPDVEAELSPAASQSAINAFELGERRWSRRAGWTVMEKQNNIWIATRVSKDRPDMENSDTAVLLYGDIGFRQDRKRDASPAKLSVTPPVDIDRYYANVDEAKAIEDVLRDRDDDTSVKLILSVTKDGKALLKGIEVNGDRNVMSWW